MLPKELFKHYFYMEYKINENKPFYIILNTEIKTLYGAGIRIKKYDILKNKLNTLKNPSLYKIKKSNIKIKNHNLNYWFVNALSKEKQKKEVFVKELNYIVKNRNKEVLENLFPKIKITDINKTKLPAYIKKLKEYEEKIYIYIQLKNTKDYTLSINYGKNILAWRILLKNENLIKKFKKKINFIINNSKYILIPVKKNENIDSFIRHIKKSFGKGVIHD